MTVKRDLKPTIRAIRADVKYKRLRENFNNLPIYQIAVDTLLAEISTLHQIREVRRLNTSDPHFIDRLIKANTQDQSSRGRLTEILMTCLKASQTLERACTALRHHILMEFTDELKSFRTKEERMYIIDMALSTFTRYIDRTKLLTDTARLVIDDIDKGSWSIRLSVQALQIDRKREATI